MTALPNFPMVSQRSTVTSDGKPSENALYDCVPASIGAVILWLEGKSQWNDTINPDKLKDAAYGEAYSNAGTDAARYVDVCKSMGFHLYSEPMYNLSTVRSLLAANKPVIFTMLDPYVDTNLSQYSGWTHVCVWFAGDSTGLTAMDPFIGQPVYKSDATWQSLLRANQVWIVEKSMSGVPQGWKDDGAHLTAPNGHYCRDGFRKWVLEHNWDPTNVPLQEEQGLTPLEGSNPPLGGGTRQLFNETMLEWTAARNVFVGYVGRELLWREGVYGQLYADRQQKIAQIAQLQAQVAQLQGQTQVSPQVLTDMQQILANSLQMEAIARRYPATS